MSLVSGFPPTISIDTLPPLPAGNNLIGQVSLSGTTPVLVTQNGAWTIAISNFPATTTPVLGQALMLASSPVVIAADQITYYDRIANSRQEIIRMSAQDASLAASIRHHVERGSTIDRRGRYDRGVQR